jgi:two-component system response regulator HydG
MKDRKTVLVVDDEPMVCLTMESLLTFDGHEVHTANGGYAALSLLEKKSFDIVFTDFAMPAMNGHELATRIKARNPSQPVIMVTAYADTILADNPLPCVDMIIGKPFTLDAIRSAVVKVCPRDDEAQAHPE